MTDGWDENRIFVREALNDIKNDLKEVRQQNDYTKSELLVLKTKVAVWSAVISAVASGVVSIIVAVVKGR